MFPVPIISLTIQYKQLYILYHWLVLVNLFKNRLLSIDLWQIIIDWNAHLNYLFLLVLREIEYRAGITDMLGQKGLTEQSKYGAKANKTNSKGKEN